MWKSPRRALTAIAILTAIGCGGDDDGNGPTGSISLTASPSTLTLAQGASGTVTVTLVRGGGFADPVNVAVTGLPSGVTLSVTPAQLTGTTTQATVTVNVGSTVPAGTYTATVTATATGIGSATANYTLTVTATPNYALTATPAAVTIGQGGSGQTTIGIQRTSFTGTPVTLTLDAPPAGITGTFNPASPVTGDQSVLTINVAGTVQQGNYNLTVKGSATGPGDKTTTVAVTVGPPPAYTLTTTPTTVSIPAGATGDVTVNIARTSFAGAVTLSLDAPPQGITATFNPAAPTGTATTSTATISVPANATLGTHNVTIKGTATGLTDRTTTVAVTVTAAATFTISATPTSVTVPAGGTGNTSVAIVRTNFTTDVALSVASVSPANAGITGVFTPATLTGATLQSNLVISAAANVTPGTYTVTAQGVGGTLTRTVPITVTVTGAASVTLSMSPATLSIQQGGSSTSTLTAVRNNYTGNITPSVTGAPTGMTVTFNPNPITSGTTSTVTVNVGAAVPLGLHTLTITGATTGAGSPTTTLAVTVTAPTGGSNFTWEFCNAPAGTVPTKFWSLSGTTWTEVTPTVVGSVTRFSFTVSAGSTGVAYTAASGGFATTIVYFAQTTDLGSFAATCLTPTTVAKTFNLSGAVGGEVGVLGYGGVVAQTGAATSYNLNVAPGTYDWLWSFGTQSGVPPTTTFANYRIGRGEAAPGAGAVAVNRAGAPAFVTAPFSFTGGGSGFWQTSQTLQGANGFVTTLSLGSILSGTGSGSMLFPQPGDRLSTDMWLLSATHLELDQNGKGDSRTSSRYVGSAPPASLTFALPGKVPAFTVSAVAGASIPWAAAGSIPAEYQATASTISATFTGAGGNASATLIATRSWLVANSMSTSYTLTGPTLPNFQAAWAPASPLTSTAVSMTATNLTGPATAGSFLNTAVRIQ